MGGGTERIRTVIVFVDSEVHKPFCHGPGKWVERRDLNPQSTHSQCVALPVKLSPTYEFAPPGKDARHCVLPNRSRGTAFLERVIGFEPMIDGFADRGLGRLAIPAKLGTRGEIRTPNILFLRQAPLPIWPRVRAFHELVRAAGFEPAKTCSQGKSV